MIAYDLLQKIRTICFSGKEKQMFIILLQGISSGVPFLLLLSTLSVWLTEEGLTKTQIGLFAWVTVPYSLKFIWAYFIDKLKVPYLTNFMGKRRSWLLISQLLLLLSLVGLGSTNPSLDIHATVRWAFLVGLFSAMQDIVVEAYRIEILDVSKLGLGAGASVFGYRLGMLCSGAGAMYTSVYFSSWHVTYNIMAAFIVLGIVATFLGSEPDIGPVIPKPLKGEPWFYNLCIQPVKMFFNRKDWWMIICLIASFKFADTILNAMSMPFLIEMGFSKVEIANVAKTFGIIAMICGGVLGGILLSHYPINNILIVSAGLQFLSSMLFLVQACVGHKLNYLFFTMGLENLTCGMSQVALITYLSKLCSKPHTAVQYAILSSIASLIRVNYSVIGGWLADSIQWHQFYLLVSFCCLPCIWLILANSSHFKEYSSSVNNLSRGIHVNKI